MHHKIPGGIPLVHQEHQSMGFAWFRLGFGNIPASGMQGMDGNRPTTSIEWKCR